MNTTPTTSAYVPGVCNINHAEIAKRRMAGHIGAGVFVVLFVAIVGLGLSSYLKLALILPAMLAAIGYLQAQEKFCIGYAGAGQQNAEEGSTTAGSITDAEALAADKRKSSQIKNKMVVYAVAATIVALAIPPYHF